MTVIDDRDLFNDTDLLDFEDPARRDRLRARYEPKRLPAPLRAARALMYTQAAVAIVLPIALAIARAGNDGTAAAERRGGGGLAALGFVAFLALLVALIVAAARLRELTSPTRATALVVEAIVGVAFVMLALGGSIAFAVQVVLAGAVTALLLARSTKSAITSATTANESVRFDIRTLPKIEA